MSSALLPARSAHPVRAAGVGRVAPSAGGERTCRGSDASPAAHAHRFVGRSRMRGDPRSHHNRWS